ncbi:hypothetical protein AMECASPLE_007927 [Ameca splendens]|uniref:Uncharacterized protein n=1 Tax=Ameca splendens TaxID=208324 RepID=A0ABV1A894_9TELE
MGLPRSQKTWMESFSFICKCIHPPRHSGGIFRSLSVGSQQNKGNNISVFVSSFSYRKIPKRSSVCGTFTETRAVPAHTIAPNQSQHPVSNLNTGFKQNCSQKVTGQILGKNQTKV